MNVPTFKSRAEAFDYMFATLCEKDMDIMEAAQKAEAFADIVAKNRALPEAPKNFVAQCMDALKQVSQIKKDYPEAWELVGGVLGGVVGLVAGSKASEASDDEPPADPIDFDNLT
jgi:hypothetical protein